MNFYASTGVVLDKVDVTARQMTVTVNPQGTSKYRVQFIGRMAWCQPIMLASLPSGLPR